MTAHGLSLRPTPYAPLPFWLVVTDFSSLSRRVDRDNRADGTQRFCQNAGGSADGSHHGQRVADPRGSRPDDERCEPDRGRVDVEQRAERQPPGRGVGWPRRRRRSWRQSRRWRRRRRGGGGGFGGGGFGGGGRGGGQGTPAGDPEETARRRNAMRDILNPPDRLTIVQTDSMVIITGPDGRTTRLVARWEENQGRVHEDRPPDQVGRGQAGQRDQRAAGRQGYRDLVGRPGAPPAAHQPEERRRSPAADGNSHLRRGPSLNPVIWSSGRLVIPSLIVQVENQRADDQMVR